jgi:hypothetical protein
MDDVDAAAARVSYQLMISRSRMYREFSRDGLTGPDIDCARTPGGSSLGGWTDPPPSGLTEQECVDWFQMIALQECVHEALEWFQVDGKPWLDPHVLESKIFVRDAVVRMWTELRRHRLTLSLDSARIEE